MTSHHFFVPPDAVQDGFVTIDGDEGRHAGRVLRVREGERITVADNTGLVVAAVVTDAGDVVLADVTAETHHERPAPQITLFQALSKGDKLDDVVEKASEVGVARVVPFVSNRSIVRWDAAKRTKASVRWRSIARAAAKQSRSPWMTEVADIADGVRAVLSVPPKSAARFVLHEGAEVRLRDVLPDETPPSLAIAVGPEGGFDPDELAELEGDADVVSLGPRILRTETAGLVAASIVAYAYGALG